MDELGRRVVGRVAGLSWDVREKWRMETRGRDYILSNGHARSL